MSYALGRPVRLSMGTYTDLTGVHPEMVRRLVALGLLDASRDADGELWFSPADVTAMARILRLRAGLNLNYAALGLVLDLLDRIDELEEYRRRQHSRFGASTWT